MHTISSLNEHMERSSQSSNSSSMHLLMTIFKIHHIMFKSDAYAMSINGKMKEGYKIKDHHMCDFGKWYDTQGMQLFEGNKYFEAMMPHHQKVHELINKNLEHVQRHGLVAADDMPIIVKRFQEAESESQELFTCMNQLSETSGSSIDFSKI